MTVRARVIQGGMGVGVSSWQLASAVSRAGQLGVVSGTALDVVLARRLQDGDPDGWLRYALAHFPDVEAVERILARYFNPGGRPDGTPYTPVPRSSVRPNRRAQELTVVANFAEVFLAKDAHDGPVGINYLAKIAMTIPFAVYGAMLAGVDVVLTGAGIPREMPGLLSDLAQGRPGTIHVDVLGSTQSIPLTVDPAQWYRASMPELRRPDFVAIVSSDILASHLARSESSSPDGVVVEGPTAGGHNAPPRGRLELDEAGEPRYGPRDVARLDRIRELGVPFWLAGGYGTPERLAEALDHGATGIQAGTVFALCAESGFTAQVRTSILDALADDSLQVSTMPGLSPTGYPFKTSSARGLPSAPTVLQDRPRLCDLGVLRTPYLREDDSIGYRCPGEPLHTYVRKGGEEAETVGVGCLCNALTAGIGLAQQQHSGYVEEPMITLGSDLDGARRLLARHPGGWTAEQALAWLTGR